MAQQRIERLEGDLKEKKEDHLREKDDLQRKLASLESEHVQTLSKEQSLSAQLSTLKAEKDKSEKELREAVKSARDENSTQIEAANARAWEFEERMKEMERNTFQTGSDHEQEVELLNKKVKYLESSLEEARKKEKDSLSEIKNSKKDHSSSLKDIQLRYEGQIKTLNSRLESEIERMQELERDFEEKEAQFDKQRTGWEEDEIKLRSAVEDFRTQGDILRLKLDRKESDTKKKIAETSKESD